jgi:hypothetical protein
MTMPSASVYCSLSQLKARLGVPDSDVRNDEMLEGIIEAVSRLIDAECNSRFDAVTETLYYTPLCGHELLVDDILAVTTLETDDTGDGTYATTWAPTDYVLAPYNARTGSQPRPYWRIETATGGRYQFPAGMRRGVRLTALKGFSELADLPAGVEEVCLHESLRQAQANVTPYGMTAGDGGGAAARTTVSLSNYSKGTLAQYRHQAVG